MHKKCTIKALIPYSSSFHHSPFKLHLSHLLRFRRKVTHVDLARHDGGDQGGAAFLEEVDHIILKSEFVGFVGHALNDDLYF